MKAPEIAPALADHAVPQLWVAADETLLQLNAAAAELLGRPAEAFIGRPLAEGASADWVEPCLAALRRVRQTGVPEKVAPAGPAAPAWEFIISAAPGPAERWLITGLAAPVQPEPRRHTEELEALYLAGQRLSQSLTAAEVCDALPDLLARRLDCNILYVSTYDPADQLIRALYAWHWGASLDVSGFPPIPLEPEGRGTQSVVIRTGRPWRLDDYQAQVRTAQTTYHLDQDGRPPPEVVAEDETIPRSALMAPILRAGQVAGVLQVFSFRPAAYTDADLRLVEALAAQLGVALHNAALYRQAQAERDARQQAEITLRARDQQLLDTLDAARMATWDLDLRAQTSRWSANAGRLFGVGASAWPVSWADLLAEVDPEDAAAVQAAFQAALAGPGAFDLEFRLRVRGEMRWVAATGHFVWGLDGRPERAHGILRDVHARRLAQTQAQLSEARFQQLADNIQEVFWLQDVASGRMLYASPAYETVWGRSAAELYADARAFLAAIHPEDHPRVRASMAATLEGRPADCEYRVLRPDGSQRWVWDRSFPILGPAGQVAQVAGVVTDITDRRLVEVERQTRAAEIGALNASLERRVAERTQALEAANARLQAVTRLQSAILDSARLAIITIDLGGVITSFNTGAERMLGYPASAVVGRTTPLILHDPAELAERAGRLAARLGRPVDSLQALLADADADAAESEWMLIRKGGQRFPAALTITPVRQGDGTVVGYLEIASDITARKQAELAVQAERDFARQVMESMGQMLLVYDLEGRVQYVNPAVTRLLGWPAEAVLGRTPADFIVTEDLPRVLAGLAERRAALPGEYEVRLRDAAGQIRDVLLTAAPRFQDGRVVGGIIVGTDLTERQQVEARLRFQAGILNAVGQAVVTTNAAGQITYWNHAAAELYGWPATEALGQDLFALLRPDLTPEQAERLRQAENWRGELTLQRRAGGQFPALVTFSHLRDERGALAGRICAATDIAALRAAERELQAQRDFARQIMETMGQGLVVCDAAGRAEYLNAYMLRLLERASAELDGISLFDFILPDDHALVTAGLAAQQQGRSETYEARVRAGNGDVRYMVVVATPRWRAGRPAGAIASFMDLTERKQAEETLRHSRDQLDLANRELARVARLKDEFLANMSHELRTPLTGILGLSEALQRGVYGVLNERQERTLHMVEESGRHLLNLINDILDLSKVEAGRLELQAAATPAYDLCQASLRLVKQMAEARRQTLHATLTPPDLVVTVDTRRFKQILVNLLSNAVKFTPEGGDLGLAVEADAVAGEARFTVWDSGIGIAPEQQAKLFQAFVQLDGGLDRQFSGTGLGLALVKRLTELHGGAVTVTSAPSQGSRFTIHVPWQAAAAPAAVAVPAGAGRPAADVAPPAGARVLLVEDNETSLVMLADYLRVQGFQVTTARDGVEAVRLAQRQAPHVILMDVQLPNLDGLEATRRIRALTGPIAQVPVIVITALAMAGDRERCLAAGATTYLSKPLDLRTLAETMRRLLAARA